MKDLQSRLGNFVMILVCLVASTGMYVSGQDSTMTSETPTPISSEDLRVFPDDLLCDRLEASSESYGASWMDITIGESTYDDLEMLVEDFDYNYLSITESQFEGRFVVEDSSVYSNDSRTPSAISYCLENEVIQVLKISYSASLAIDHPELSDFVMTFGIPDVVTWTNNPSIRVVFWLDLGFAAAVSLPIDGEVDQTRVFQEIYFPIQPSLVLKSEWPLVYIRATNPYLVSPDDASVDFGLENPFNFDAIVATVTAQPSRTPTATFEPSIVTATATP